MKWLDVLTCDPVQARLILREGPRWNAYHYYSASRLRVSTLSPWLMVLPMIHQIMYDLADWPGWMVDPSGAFQINTDAD